MHRRDGAILPPGGHLAVVLGFKKEKNDLKGFIVNHPSSKHEYNWSHRFIELPRFEASFSGSFMSFWTPKGFSCSR
jgi:hypothetical protein